jgi:hypothetical protein
MEIAQKVAAPPQYSLGVNVSSGWAGCEFVNRPGDCQKHKAVGGCWGMFTSVMSCNAMVMDLGDLDGP